MADMPWCSNCNDYFEGHCMSAINFGASEDDCPMIKREQIVSTDDVSGIAVWSFPDPEGGFDHWWHNPGENEDGKPHVAHSLSAQAQAARRDAVERAIDDASKQGLGISSQARYVLTTLGLLTDDADETT